MHQIYNKREWVQCIFFLSFYRSFKLSEHWTDTKSVDVYKCIEPKWGRKSTHKKVYKYDVYNWIISFQCEMWVAAGDGSGGGGKYIQQLITTAR